MYPTLFKFGIFEFHSYTVLLAAAFLSGVYLWFRLNAARPEPFDVTPIGALLLFIGVLLGSKVFFYLQFGQGPWWRVFFLWEGGLVFYGGLIGGVLAGLAYLVWHRQPIVPIGDSIMPLVPFFHGIGRFGCFLNGCCWGLRSDAPWAVAFPKGSPPFNRQVSEGLLSPAASHAHPVHPTQLYETFALFLIGAVLLVAARFSPGRPGLLMALYPLLYGLVRLVIEAFRGDSARQAAGLTVSQVISVLLICGSVAALALLWSFVWRRQPPNPDAGEAPGPVLER